MKERISKMLMQLELSLGCVYPCPAYIYTAKGWDTHGGAYYWHLSSLEWADVVSYPHYSAIFEIFTMLAFSVLFSPIPTDRINYCFLSGSLCISLKSTYLALLNRDWGSYLFPLQD